MVAAGDAPLVDKACGPPEPKRRELTAVGKACTAPQAQQRAQPPVPRVGAGAAAAADDGAGLGGATAAAARPGGCSSGRAAGSLDMAEHAAHLHRRALGDGDVGDGGGGGRRHLDGDLVGLELAQRLVKATLSPTFTIHLETVASVIDSAGARNLDLDGHDSLS